ncbi:MAG: YceI family protein [Cyclobacteriaceae bacterium]
MKLFISILLLIPAIGFAQKFKSDSSYVRFFSEAPLENIEAVNIKGASIIDLSNGNFAFSVPVNQFRFDKSLMEEHFNENYLETEKFPKTTFTGSFKPADLVNGEQTVSAIGEFNLHGQTKPVNIEGTVIKDNGQVTIKAVFDIKLVDYKIKIPKAVFYNIAEEVEVTVYFEYKEL